MKQCIVLEFSRLRYGSTNTWEHEHMAIFFIKLDGHRTSVRFETAGGM